MYDSMACTVFLLPRAKQELPKQIIISVFSPIAFVLLKRYSNLVIFFIYTVVEQA
jgi:hypothetical protein